MDINVYPDVLLVTPRCFLVISLHRMLASEFHCHQDARLKRLKHKDQWEVTPIEASEKWGLSVSSWGYP